MSERCVRCGAEFACGSVGPGTCWCVEFPAVMPVTDEGCLCRECLEREVAARVARVGLCARCGHARSLRSKNGTDVYMCQLSAKDRRFAKYPRLPMAACAGYAEVARP